MRNSPPLGPLSRPLLTAREVSALLRCCRANVYALATSGELACVRIAAAVRFAPEDVEAFIAARRSPPPPAGGRS